MQPSVYAYLRNQPDLHYVVRRQPEWYRLLSRDPAMVTELEKAAKVFYGKTWQQQMGKAGQRLDMLQMIIQLAAMMRD